MGLKGHPATAGPSPLNAAHVGVTRSPARCHATSRLAIAPIVGQSEAESSVAAQHLARRQERLGYAWQL